MSKETVVTFRVAEQVMYIAFVVGFLIGALWVLIFLL